MKIFCILHAANCIPYNAYRFIQDVLQHQAKITYFNIKELEPYKDQLNDLDISLGIVIASDNEITLNDLSQSIKEIIKEIHN